MSVAKFKTRDQAFSPEFLPAAILENIKDPVQVIDPGYRVVWCNTCSGGGKTWGPENLVGRICYEAFFQRQSPCPDCPLAETLATGKPGAKEKLFSSKDGQTIWRRVHSYPLGFGGLVVKIGFDITQEKTSQQRLQRDLERMETALGQESPAPVTRGLDPGLTPREKEVLKLMAKGLSGPAMARVLGISPHTVKTHVGHVYDKLGVGDRASAAVQAARLGLV